MHEKMRNMYANMHEKMPKYACKYAEYFNSKPLSNTEKIFFCISPQYQNVPEFARTYITPKSLTIIKKWTFSGRFFSIAISD